VRVMCSSRFNPAFIVNALLQGADGVLISGCHPGECHYVSGNYLARRRLVLLRRFLEHLGIHPDRLRMSWVSASEGAKWAEVVKEVTADIKALGPNDIKRERVWMQQSL
jgi:F420-non-reducing hydrogenase iron-sulfur subunit